MMLPLLTRPAADFAIWTGALAQASEPGLLETIADDFREYLAEDTVHPLLVLGVLVLGILVIVAYRMLRPRLMVRQEADKLFASLAAANGLLPEEERELRLASEALGLENPLIVYTRRSLLERHADGVRTGKTEPAGAQRLQRLQSLIEKLFS
ncbi:MAG: hypothetical protein RDV41_08280 [Planctomycetota bacterium]|nr:hypothetical protein [Planctomycetota bacterium]